MFISQSDFEVMNRLVGKMDMATAGMLKKNIDYFLEERVGLFIPASGQCNYAITPNHTHPAYSFVYYFQSVSEIIIEEKMVHYDISDGKCLSALSPGIPHQEPEQEDFQSYIAIMIEKSLFEQTASQYLETIPVFRGERFAPHLELLTLLKCFMLEAGEYEHKKREYLQHLSIVLTHLLVRSLIPCEEKESPLYDRFEVDHAVAYMNVHYSEKITNEKLAEVVCLSEGHFLRVFKTVTGMTPIDFLNLLRLKKARIMLTDTTTSITEIALKCGFHSSSYFSSRFLEKYHQTPSFYRIEFRPEG